METAILTLSAHRWNVPVLAALGERGRASFGELRDGLEVCRDSLTRSLRALVRPGWIRRRREYELTPPGRAVARPSAAILALARAHAAESVVLRKWTLPVASALEGWSLSFAELRALLPSITPRALALALKAMAAEGLLTREVIGGFPPATSYALTERGRDYLPALAEIATVD
jgi:DNA-binding HxlR family transcriptional regulator